MDFDTSALRTQANSPQVHSTALSLAMKLLAVNVEDLSPWNPPEEGLARTLDQEIERIAEAAAKLVKCYIVALEKV